MVCDIYPIYIYISIIYLFPSVGGFWGHRYGLYYPSKPHTGYHLMKEWAEKMPNGYFVFTSNVDGHWNKVIIIAIIITYY